MNFSNRSHVRCLSTHLTTFAILVNLHGNDVKLIPQGIKIIAWITGHFRCRTGYPLSILICWLWYIIGLSSSYYHYTSNILVSIFVGRVYMCLNAIILCFSKSLLKDLHYFVHFNLSVALFMGLAIFLAGIDNAKGNDVSYIIMYLP